MDQLLDETRSKLGRVPALALAYEFENPENPKDFVRLL